jgi:nucleoside-diphosphate-sugar epimerase
MASSLSVLVLGATGIIGQDLCAVAHDRGYAVTALSRGSQSVARGEPIDGVEYVVGDVYDPAGFAALVGERDFDVVVDLLSFRPDQLEKTLRLFAGRCGQYMFVSSATVYEDPGVDGVITEATPRIDGPWSYPLRKLDCERFLVERCRQSGQRYTIVRPYITYSDQRVAFGAWEAESVLHRLITGRSVVVGDELATTMTSLTHSADLARAMVGLMANPRAHDEDFHVASEEPVTWGDVFQLAAQAANCELNVAPATTAQIVRVFPELAGKVADRRRRRAFDNSKLFEACPGFAFEHTVGVGYREAIPRLIARRLPTVGPVAQGRMDRLAGRGSARALVESREMSSTLRRSSMGDYIRYEVGRRESLYRIKLTLDRLTRKSPASNYGVR